MTSRCPHSPGTSSAEPHTSHSDRTKRQETATFDPVRLAYMSYTFSLPDTLPTLLALSTKHWNLGYTIAKLLYHIAPVVSTHLHNAVDFQSPVPRALIDMAGFVASIDAYVAHLRLTDGYSKLVPTASNERKVKAAKRKYVDRFKYVTEAAFKTYIAETFDTVFGTWTKEQTRMFNKGVDEAVSGVQWVVYPEKCVVLGAKEGDWSVWLRNECEELGKEEVRAGRRALEGM